MIVMTLLPLQKFHNEFHRQDGFVVGLGVRGSWVSNHAKHA